MKTIMDEPKTLPCWDCKGRGQIEVMSFHWHNDHTKTDAQIPRKIIVCPHCKGLGVIDYPKTKR